MPRTVRRKAPSSPIKLGTEELAFARTQQVLIEQQKRITASLETALMRYLEDRYHINLKDESWSLDTEAGTLKRVLGEPEWKELEPVHE